MKPLLNTLFITTEGVYLGLDGETIVISKEKEVLARVPLHNFEQVTVFGYLGASPALMKKCAENWEFRWSFCRKSFPVTG